MIGKLAGVAECSNAQLAAAAAAKTAAPKSRPAPPAPPSEVGSVDVGSGAGPTPLYVPGHAYLAGPYKGAPSRLAIITPAWPVPSTSAPSWSGRPSTSTPKPPRSTPAPMQIPHILQGHPARRPLGDLKLDRPNFTLNPTNCKELFFAGSTTSVLGAVRAALDSASRSAAASPSPFNPKLASPAQGREPSAGATRRFKAVLTYPKGGAYANIAKSVVTLPRSEFLDNAHIDSRLHPGPVQGHGPPAKVPAGLGLRQGQGDHPDPRRSRSKAPSTCAPPNTSSPTSSPPCTTARQA